jgi:serine/threonine protein kinase
MVTRLLPTIFSEACQFERIGNCKVLKFQDIIEELFHCFSHDSVDRIIWNLSMSAERWQMEEQLFLDAINYRDHDERLKFLQRRCHGEPELQKRVNSLLEAYDLGEHHSKTPVAEHHIERLMSIPANADTDDVSIREFLEPSDKPNSLGKLGRYEIQEVIGYGAMGIVLGGRDPRLDRAIAVKMMAPSLAVDGTARERFVREARIAASLKSDNIVTIYDIESSGRLPYMVMERIYGESLADLVEKNGPAPVAEAVNLSLQIARALSHAHRMNVVHRDIKPSNILIEKPAGRVKITDFGLARSQDDLSLTRTGHVAGTPLFMSPEQTRGRAVDSRSDLFSLGCTMYMMCTGQTPFSGDSSYTAMREICEKPPQPINEINPDMPDWLVTIVSSLLEKQPDDRLKSADRLVAVLSRCQRRLRKGKKIEVVNYKSQSTDPEVVEIKFSKKLNKPTDDSPDESFPTTNQATGSQIPPVVPIRIATPATPKKRRRRRQKTMAVFHFGGMVVFGFLGLLVGSLILHRFLGVDVRSIVFPPEPVNVAMPTDGVNKLEDRDNHPVKRSPRIAQKESVSTKDPKPETKPASNEVASDRSGKKIIPNAEIRSEESKPQLPVFPIPRVGERLVPKGDVPKVTPAVVSPKPIVRLAIPAQPLDDEVIAVLQEYFQGDLDNVESRKGVEKLLALNELARKVFMIHDDESQISIDPELRYAVFCEATRLAVAGGDPDLTFEIVGKFAEQFEIDDLNIRSSAVHAWSDQLAKYFSGDELREKRQELFEIVRPLARRADREHYFARAAELYQLAIKLAADDADIIELRKQNEASMTKADRHQKMLERSGEVLAEEDPEKCLELGKYWCFELGDWATGLAHLAHCSDETMKTAAQLDLQGAESPEGFANIADHWWDLSEQVDENFKNQVLSRAGYWYENAKPGSWGPLRKKIDLRLEKIESSSIPKDGAANTAET